MWQINYLNLLCWIEMKKNLGWEAEVSLLEL